MCCGWLGVETEVFLICSANWSKAVCVGKLGVVMARVGRLGVGERVNEVSWSRAGGLPVSVVAPVVTREQVNKEGEGGEKLGGKM